MDAVNNLPLVAAIIACQQLLAAAMIIFYDHPTRYEARMEKKKKRELTPYKRNVSLKVGPPETTLELVRVLDDILADDNHEYMRKMTHLHPWQFFVLADCLKDLIKRPRANHESVKVGPTPKHDQYHRLFFALKWLNDGTCHMLHMNLQKW